MRFENANGYDADARAGRNGFFEIGRSQIFPSHAHTLGIRHHRVKESVAANNQGLSGKILTPQQLWDGF